MTAPWSVPGLCLVCDGKPRVLIAMRHPTMLRFTRELLEDEFSCSITTERRSGEALTATIDRVRPDVMIIDAAGFPRSCLEALDHIRRDRVIVIGPEPDPSYRTVALAHGAGAWLARERVGDDLAMAVRRVLGCAHEAAENVRRERVETTDAELV